MILGLKVSKFDKLCRGIVDNFLYEMKTFGIIPNSSELAHLSRSQPPFLTSMMGEVWNGDLDWMNTNTHYHKELGLNKYFDNLEGMLRVPGEAYLHYGAV